jgi:hypothetical protein
MSKLNYILKGSAKHILDLVVSVFPIFQYYYTNDSLSEMYFTDDALTEPLVSEDT